MPNCGANKCTNRSTEYPEKSFHRLPNDEKKKELRKAWLLKINRKHIPKKMYICSFPNFDLFPDLFFYTAPPTHSKTLFWRQHHCEMTPAIFFLPPHNPVFVNLCIPHTKNVHLFFFPFRFLSCFFSTLSPHPFDDFVLMPAPL